MFSISFREQRDGKKENHSLTLIVFAHAIIMSTARAS